MHAGAEDLRILLTTDVTNNFLPASWQASLDALSYSVVGLWDSIMRAFAIFGSSRGVSTPCWCRRRP